MQKSFTAEYENTYNDNTLRKMSFSSSTTRKPQFLLFISGAQKCF